MNEKQSLLKEIENDLKQWAKNNKLVFDDPIVCSTADTLYLMYDFGKYRYLIYDNDNVSKRELVNKLKDIHEEYQKTNNDILSRGTYIHLSIFDYKKQKEKLIEVAEINEYESSTDELCFKLDYIVEMIATNVNLHYYLLHMEESKIDDLKEFMLLLKSTIDFINNNIDAGAFELPYFTMWATDKLLPISLKHEFVENALIKELLKSTKYNILDIDDTLIILNDDNNNILVLNKLFNTQEEVTTLLNNVSMIVKQYNPKYDSVSEKNNIILLLMNIYIDESKILQLVDEYSYSTSDNINLSDESMILQ